MDTTILCIVMLEAAYRNRDCGVVNDVKTEDITRHN